LVDVVVALERRRALVALVAHLPAKPALEERVDARRDEVARAHLGAEERAIAIAFGQVRVVLVVVAPIEGAQDAEIEPIEVLLEAEPAAELVELDRLVRQVRAG